jgi:DNA-binding NarL/FixJ family response regulator
VITVLIAAGEARLRAGCRAPLESHELIQVVSEAASGRHAVLDAADLNPDVTLVELGLPGLDLPHMITRIVCAPRTAVLLLASGTTRTRTPCRAVPVGENPTSPIGLSLLAGRLIRSTRRAGGSTRTGHRDA